MNVLFIHGNFPGQFRQLATAMAAAGHQIRYLSHPGTGERWSLPGVEVRRFWPHREPRPDGHPYLLAVEEAVLHGQAICRAVMDLLVEGWRPDRVVFHGGLGYGLFLRPLLAGVPLIGYFEWWFQDANCLHLTGDDSLDQRLRVVTRNMPILSELQLCDQAVTATEWQRQQFPEPVRQKLRVIFDGIDQSFFHPPADQGRLADDLVLRAEGQPISFSSSDLILTYATRGMEPVRGFPEFLRAAPELLTRFPRLKIVIAGQDRRAYSYDAPSHGGSWKLHLLAELGEFVGRERLIFAGSLSYSDYRSLLWRSDLHCYLSRPYVPSWSLFEALACGCRLAVNAGAMMDPVVDRAFILLDLDDPAGLAPSLGEALSRLEAGPCSGSVAEKSLDLWLPVEFGLDHCLGLWRDVLI